MLSKKPSGSAFFFLYFLFPFLVLSLFFPIIKVRALLPTTLLSLLAPNILISAIISFAIILPMVLFVLIGYPPPTYPPISLPSLCLTPFLLNIAPPLALSLFDYFYFIFYFLCSFFLSLSPDGGVLEYQDFTSITLSVM